MLCMMELQVIVYFWNLLNQGSDCEQLVCVACMVVAEVTLTQLPSLSGAKSDFLARVCQHADLRLRFSDLTTIICDHLANSKVCGYTISAVKTSVG